MQQALEFRLLGPLEVARDGSPIAIGGRKLRSLLVLLLLHRDQVVPAERLSDQLWDGAPPPSAANALQVYVSQLRKALGSAELIETHPLGYRLRVPAAALDLHQFEQRWQQGREQLQSGDHASASDALADALALWRGDPLSDVAYESFGAGEARRLEELRLEATVDRIEADLACGRHQPLVSELSALVREHPLKERLSCQLMLALYRSGRQADALAAAADARSRLDGQYGLAPTAELRDLERAILNQDATLDLAAAPARDPAPKRRQLVVAALRPGQVAGLAALAASLASGLSGHELVLLRITGRDDDLAGALAELRKVAPTLEGCGTTSRMAAFSSNRMGYDLSRLVEQEPVDLIISGIDPAAGIDPDAGALLAALPCDVALVSRPRPLPAGHVLVPFTGSDHDWAAVGAAAAYARASGAELRLLGSAGGASRLLATASLVIQRAFRVEATPLLVEAGAQRVVAAAEGASLVVAGLSQRWHERGLGTTRAALIASDATVMLVRAGARPSAWAPANALTRFTWSVAPQS